MCFLQKWKHKEIFCMIWFTACMYFPLLSVSKEKGFTVSSLDIFCLFGVFVRKIRWADGDPGGAVVKFCKACPSSGKKIGSVDLTGFTCAVGHPWISRSLKPVKADGNGNKKIWRHWGSVFLSGKLARLHKWHSKVQGDLWRCGPRFTEVC